MISKEFVYYNDIRDNTIKLMDKIYREDGFYPDFMIVCLRGGTYSGNIVSEYFKTLKRKNVIYSAVIPRSYVGINQKEEIKIDGWTHHPSQIDPDSKVFIVDDIYDSGLTINTICQELFKNGIKKENVKIMVHEYKNRLHLKEKPSYIKPDYWCRKIDIVDPEKDDIWLHYLSHELLGLTDSEIDTYYNDPEIKDILKNLNKN